MCGVHDMYQLRETPCAVIAGVQLRTPVQRAHMHVRCSMCDALECGDGSTGPVLDRAVTELTAETPSQAPPFRMHG